MDSFTRCNINVMISDMTAAIDFYRDTLGLELVKQFGEHYAQMKAGDLLVGLHPATREVVVGNNLAIGFGVTHFDSECEKLKEEKISLQFTQEGGTRLTHFTDPDGNNLFLAEVKD